MKKITTYAFTLLFALTASTGFTQEYKNAIKTNPLGLFANQFQLQYERALSEKFSAQISVGYISRSITSNVGYNAKTNGMIIIPELKYYFKESLNGPYLSAFSRIRPTTLDADYDYDEGSKNTSYVDKNLAIGGGLLFGYHIDVAEGFVIDTFIGPQYKSISTNRTYDDPNVSDDDDIDFVTFKRPEKDGLGVRFGINIGYAF